MANFVAYTEDKSAKKSLANVKFEWNISKFIERIKSAKTGEFLELSNIHVGDTKWYFRLYPNGKEPTSKGFVSLYCYSKNETKETIDVYVTVLENLTNIYIDWHFTFLSDGNGWGSEKLLDHKILSRREGILSNGNLLLVIKMIQPSNQDKHSPISISSMQTAERLKCIVDFQNDSAFSDVQIKCGDKVFYCHRVILARRSDYFKSMFENHFKEGQTGFIDMESLDAVTLEAILRFLYGGGIEKLNENGVELLKASQMLDLKDLSSVCEQYLLADYMNLDNVIDVLLMAETHNAKTLKKGAINAIVSNSDIVRSQADWKDKLANSPMLALELFEAMAEKKQ